MKVNIFKLKYSGTLNSQETFNYTPNSDILSGTDWLFDGLAQVDACLYICGDDCTVDLIVNYKLCGGCSKCLESAASTHKAELETTYYRTKESDTDFVIEKGYIDLALAANQAILLSLPYTLLCKDNCQGLCTKCGTNLNLYKCNC